MGLELSEEAIRQNMPEYALMTRPDVSINIIVNVSS